MTKQRAAILDIMRSSSEHMSAQEIFELLKKRLPDTVVATVYNNLNALEAAGEIRRLHFDGEVDRFDKTSSLHAHVVCVNCGAVADADFAGLPEFLESTLGTEVVSYELTVNALCDECKQKSMN